MQPYTYMAPVTTTPSIFTRLTNEVIENKQAFHTDEVECKHSCSGSQAWWSGKPDYYNVHIKNSASGKGGAGTDSDPDHRLSQENDYVM